MVDEEKILPRRSEGRGEEIGPRMDTNGRGWKDGNEMGLAVRYARLGELGLWEEVALAGFRERGISAS